MTVKILTGDALTMLRALPAASVQCCVTSPPYYGLRDYGTARWESGDPACLHVVGEIRTGAGMAALGARYSGGGHKATEPKPIFAKEQCPHCGARRVDSQIGIEATPEEYIARMVEVFAAVYRVLRDDGTLWLNIGDSYATKANGPIGGSGLGGSKTQHAETRRARATRSTFIPPGYKHKDLLGIPWMLAFALRADGWYLRSDIIWHKPNPMPESVTDRPTKAHEQVFLFTKAPRYFYDAAAIREEDSGQDHPRNILHKPAPPGGVLRAHTGIRTAAGRNGQGRNARSVWTIATHPFTGAHFATMPPELAERCIKAGSSEHGACASCGSPWKRKLERKFYGDMMPDRSKVAEQGYTRNSMPGGSRHHEYEPPRTLGWEPSCACRADAVPCTVLDPFGGAGTTGLVADRLGRDALLIELNPAYADMARSRIRGDAPLLVDAES